ncbi:MAG: BlaI/MecI/CopY family transcriptional regulator [Lachnospiraceae bacterium]|nr:BlaI/MecI/CopY family transcriptional regulator [Lachnospiraceae bacterium]
MADLQMGPIESRFADIIWENEPITTSELVSRSEKAFSWKKTTTYTVLKRLCEKGIFQTVKGTVTSLMSRREFYSVQSENFVNDTFDGSLPAFFAAFTARKALTPEEIAELKQMIDSYGEGK